MPSAFVGCCWVFAHDSTKSEANHSKMWLPTKCFQFLGSGEPVEDFMIARVTWFKIPTVNNNFLVEKESVRIDRQLPKSRRTPHKLCLRGGCSVFNVERIGVSVTTVLKGWSGRFTSSLFWARVTIGCLVG